MDDLVRFTKAGVALLTIMAMAACTPAFTQQKAGELATQARLREGVQIERTNHRLLSRQAQICLISDRAGTAAGAQMLRSAQAGFNGYFIAVGVENEPMDYLRAIAYPPCPMASYLFFLQPLDEPDCSGSNQTCNSLSDRYSLAVISAGDQTLVDRITLSIRNGLIPAGGDAAERLQSAFAQLAIALTGAEDRR